MKKMGVVAIFLTIVVLASTFAPLASCQETSDSQKPRERLIDIFAKVFFKSTVYIFGMPWNVMRFTEPDPFAPDSKYIEIGFYDTKSIIIGIINESSGQYKSLKDFDYHPLFPGADFEFKIEFPDYLPKDSFIATFDPQRLDLYVDGEAKTKLTLTSGVPYDTSLPENIQIRVNITKYVTAENTYLPAKGNRGIMPFNLITGKGSTVLWFLAAIGVTSPFAFGPYYSGKRVADYSTYVDIIIKLKRSHLVDIIPPQKSIELTPDSIYSIPIQVKNFGSHVDTFNFRASTDLENSLTLAPPSSLTLGPDETKIVNLGVATSDELWDPGTLHSIKIEAYSIYKPEVSFNNTVSLITKGIHVSENNAFYLIFNVFVFILLIVIVYLFRKQIKTKLKMSKRSKIKKEVRKTKRFLFSLKSKKEIDEVKVAKKRQIKTKPTTVKKEEIVETEVVKEEPVIKPKVDLKAEEERRKKEKALAKIRKKQGK